MDIGCTEAQFFNSGICWPVFTLTTPVSGQICKECALFELPYENLWIPLRQDVSEKEVPPVGRQRVRLTEIRS